MHTSLIILSEQERKDSRKRKRRDKKGKRGREGKGGDGGESNLLAWYNLLTNSLKNKKSSFAISSPNPFERWKCHSSWTGDLDWVIKTLAKTGEHLNGRKSRELTTATQCLGSAGASWRCFCKAMPACHVRCACAATFVLWV